MNNIEKSSEFRCKKPTNVHRHNSIYSDVKDLFWVSVHKGASAMKITQNKRDWARTQLQKDSRRGRITGFSRKARQRQMWLCNSLNQEKINPREILFVTLTYPAEYIVHKGREISVGDIDGKIYKYHLNHFVTRLKQKFPTIFGVTRFEWQPRRDSTGIPVGHYHLALFGTNGRRGGWIDKDWLSKTWNDVVGGDADHLKMGTNLQQAQSWNETKSYFDKRIASPMEDGEPFDNDGGAGPKCKGSQSSFVGYLSKEHEEVLNELTGEIVSQRSIGRHWSYINMKIIREFIDEQVLGMTREQFYAFRRLMFKFLKSVKYKHIVGMDESGVTYQEYKYKMHRWKKVQVAYRKWKRTRIEMGGSISAFLPNEIVRKIMVQLGHTGLDFESRYMQSVSSG